ncbi:MAG: class I SAM-dependent methyltransferase [Deltaproteobacteria bacterium]|nr:class I SAM-dependent methyltransferase [Deltaproteobacteria bacterium]
MKPLSKEEYDEVWRRGLDYARFNPGGRHRRRLIAGALHGLPYRSLLDVGCGNGMLLAELAGERGRDARFAGCDISDAVIELNRRQQPELTFFQLDIERQAPPGTYDAVVCSEIIEHLGDRNAAIGHLSGAVAPGGHLLLTFPVGRVYPTDRYFGHTTHPSLDEVLRLARGAGLEPGHHQLWGWPVLAAYRWAINVAPDWSIRNFAASEYGLSQRLLSGLVYAANFLNLPDTPRGCQALCVFKKAAR